MLVHVYILSFDELRVYAGVCGCVCCIMMCACVRARVRVCVCASTDACHVGLSDPADGENEDICHGCRFEQACLDLSS